MSARAAVLVVLLAAAAWAGGPRRVTIQRGVNGTVNDCYIWAESLSYNGNSNILYVGRVGTLDKRAFLSFDLSSIEPKSVVIDARVVLEASATNGVEVRLFEVNKPWMETEPTWMGFSDAQQPDVVGRFTPVTGRNTVDVTAMVQRWVDGRPNNGFALLQDTLTAPSTFISSDDSTISARPALELLLSPPPPPAGPLVTSSVPSLEAACAVDFIYPLKAHAPDARNFTTTGAPEGLTLDASTGVITWTPTPAARGEHTFTVTVSDSIRKGELPVTLSVDCRGPLRVGCSAAPPGALGLMALLLFARRRR